MVQTEHLSGMTMVELTNRFIDHFGSRPELVARAPGRVNLLGEHVDYNAGPVLPAAIDRAVSLAARRNEDGIVRLYALDLAEDVQFDLADLDAKIDVEGRALPGWARYPAGVVWALVKKGLAVTGLDGVFTSDVPIGAGLSSSAALETAFAVTWQQMGGWEVDRMTLARLCQRAENEYVGVNCGLMDQFASAHGVAGHALYFDTRSLEWEALPLPQEALLVVADSGVRRSLAVSGYNERRAACEQAVALLKTFLPHIESLRDVSPTEFAALSEYLPESTRRRAEHVVKEIARVQSAAVALRNDDRQSFGALMYAGHASLRDLYEVSTPELDALVEISRGLPGCIGARLTGAGFGGCTVNLVEAGAADDFIEGLTAGYRELTGRQAQVYLCQASQGAEATLI
jgi:galactokinase